MTADDKKEVLKLMLRVLGQVDDIAGEATAIVLNTLDEVEKEEPANEDHQ